jgi:hypothetical protein
MEVLVSCLEDDGNGSRFDFEIEEREGEVLVELELDEFGLPKVVRSEGKVGVEGEEAGFGTFGRSD